MSGKMNRKMRRAALSSSAGAISVENPMARAEFRLPAVIEHSVARLNEMWKWLQNRSKTQRRNRKLRVCESAQLGDKKFVALIQADGQRFLIGGTSTSVSLLATLPSRKSFRSLLPQDASLEAHE